VLLRSCHQVEGAFLMAQVRKTHST
jgi:hypothetical protein